MGHATYIHTQVSVMGVIRRCVACCRYMHAALFPPSKAEGTLSLARDQGDGIPDGHGLQE